MSSSLGYVLRNNHDLHRALYDIVGTLAAAYRTDFSIHGAHLQHLCALANAALPHLPAPDAAAETKEMG